MKKPTVSCPYCKSRMHRLYYHLQSGSQETDIYYCEQCGKAAKLEFKPVG